VTNWPQTIREKWFVAARSEQLHRRPLSVSVLTLPLALGRTQQGNVFAFEDRCPHRHVPLSAGRITENGLQCIYHGWTFGADGKCRAIPGLAPDEPIPSIGVKTVECLEINGLIWVRLAKASAGNAPDMAPPLSMTTPLVGATSLSWQTKWTASVIDALENFLDPLHTHTIHPGLVRKSGHRKPVSATIKQTEDGFIVEYGGQEQQSGLLYQLFESPRISECAVFAGAASAKIEYRYKNSSAINITLHFTPETLSTTHVFASIEVANRWAPKWALQLFAWPFLRKVMRQDQKIVELQSANKLRFVEIQGMSTQLDLVRPYLEKLWGGNNGSSLDTFEKTIKLHI
jgi:phenylpropionate dioxygenase-like ring-hydroxylating dioxygenase large terminal subunit